MFEDLLKNIEQEKKILLDLRSIHESVGTHPENQRFYIQSANSLINQLRILNNSVPKLLEAWSPIKKFAKKPKVKKVSKRVLSLISPKSKERDSSKDTVRIASKSEKGEKHYVTINKKDKKEFIEKMKISAQGLSSLKKMKEKKEKVEELKPSPYAKISNKLFRGLSENLSSGFGGLKTDLKKANMRFLLTTYISMAILSTLFAFILGVLVFGVLLIVDISFVSYFWIVVLFPVLVFAFFYMYPSSEAGSVQKKINQELPFATIQMSAIAGADITPVKIFRIISESSEYPNVGKEIRKIIAQIEIYGYDLVTSLKNVASRTSNKKLSELFAGIATNVSTGGALKNYLNKKSENFLLDYKLERQKYIDLAGTFMDIYISILIAAPLVLMMMFIVMNVAGLGMAGLGITALLFLSVGVVIIINIIFIFVLNLKQPKI